MEKKIKENEKTLKSKDSYLPFQPPCCDTVVTRQLGESQKPTIA